MITSFVYTLSQADYKSFYTLKSKLSKENLFLYILCISMIALGIYQSIRFNSTVYIAVTICYMAVFTLFWVLQKIIIPASQIKRMKKQDSCFDGKNEMIITSNAVEINYIPCKDEASIRAVYPYYVMSGVFETQKYYYFLLLSGETQILPKAAIPEDNAEQVANMLKKLTNYMFVK